MTTPWRWTSRVAKRMKSVGIEQMVVPGELASPAKLLDGPRVWTVDGKGLLTEAVDVGLSKIPAVVE